MISTMLNNLKNIDNDSRLNLVPPNSSRPGTSGNSWAIANLGSRIIQVLGRISLTALLVGLGAQAISQPNALLAANNPGLASEFSGFRQVNADFTVSDTFSSHLPLLVIKAGLDESGSLGGPVRLTAHAGSSGLNALNAVPEAIINVFLTEDGHGNGPDKGSYTVKLADTAGDNSQKKISLAGLPEAGQWRLQGSARDKGMLRSGLAYAFGRILFPESTPETRYCEVLYNVDGQYYYQGIYILTESVDQVFQSHGGANDGRFLLEYSAERYMPRENSSQPGDEDSFLSKTLSDRGFAMIYPANEQLAMELRAETELESLESALNSLTPGTFLKYLSIMDQESVIDLFILNEMMLPSGYGGHRRLSE